MAFKPLMDIVIINPTSPNMVQMHHPQQHMQRQLLIKKKQNHTQKHAPRDDFNPFAIDIYGCIHFCFSSFFIFYV